MNMEGVRIKCRICGRISKAPVIVGRCHYCGSWNVKIVKEEVRTDE